MHPSSIARGWPIGAKSCQLIGLNSLMPGPLHFQPAVSLQEDAAAC